MVAVDHRTFVYVGLAGEGDYIGEGGIVRRADGEEGWTDISKGLPENAQVRALAIQPDDPTTVFAGTDTGVYRSKDRGETWEALNDATSGHEVWSLAIHPDNPNVILAGYDPCSISRSEDGGDTWKMMDTSQVVYPFITTYMPPTAKRVIGMAFDPSNTKDIYAAVEVGGLLASRDGGDTWVSMIDGPYLKNNTLDLHQVEVSAAAPGTVHIATQTAMFRSRDKGARWEHVQVEEMFPGGSYCRDLLVAPDDPKTIYLAAGAGGGAAPPDTVQEGALFRSRDVGETWDRLDLGETVPGRMMAIAIDAAAPDHIYCAEYSGEVYSSSDGGSNWSKSVLPGESSRYLHVYPMVCG
ncbi:MAG: hypothetical protein MK158_12595 [Dehalococcoidia bacterium]|jgi:photosystem II stability/assembly factor-like uncharacterized protein|nr:hypothetical protein [Dehalococcoidia bacterium]